MSRLLAVETSSEACSVALMLGQETIAREFHEPRRHAELLLPAVREVLAESGLALADLDAIAFGRGPGSFTSLRIGIGVVQGLAWGADIGVVPVSSLAALARGAARRHGCKGGARVVTAMDARMGEVFHAKFEVSDGGDVKVIGGEHVAPPAALTVSPAGDWIAAGNGFQRFPELERLGHSMVAVYTQLWPSAREVADLAGYWLTTNQALPAHQAQPVYIRDHVADKPGAGP